MSGRREVQLGDVATVMMGQSPRGEDCNRSGVGMPLLNGPTEFGSRSPIPTQWTSDPRRMAETGDVLFCVRGSTTGRMNIADRPYAIGRGIASIRANGSADDTLLLRHLVGLNLPRLLALTTGSTFPNLSKPDLEGLTFDWPASEDRVAISEILGALDDKIDVNQRIAGAAEELAVSELAAVADGVDWVELGDVASHERSSVNPALFEGEVDHFSIPAFDAGQLPVREPGVAIKSNKLSVPDRAVLVSRLNPRIPRVWFARTNEGVPAVCSTEFLVLRPKGELSEGELFAACSHPDVLADMTRRAGGTSGSHQRIRPADALSVAVPNPRSDALRMSLTPLLETAAQARAESATLAELRDALLPKLLSGELRVGDAEAELEEAGV